MTIAENLVQDIQDEIEAEHVSQQVTNTLPFAVLKILGVIHNNTKTPADGEKAQTILEEEDFVFVSETLQRVLNLLGWSPVVTGVEEDGSAVIGLIPLGFGDADDAQIADESTEQDQE